MMNSKFLILKDYNLSIERYKNDTNLEDMLNFLDHEFKHPDFSFVNKIIVDLRGCKFNYKDVCVANALQLGKKYKENRNYFSLVYLTNSPIETAFSTLCVNHIQLKNGFFEICSTIGAALKLLNLEICQEDMEEMIRNI
jgi:hypothetical protein